MQPIAELNPPVRLLMGPGPSNVDPRVLRAMATPVIGHLDPAFLALMDETIVLTRQVYRTENPFTIPISGTGSAGMEAVFCNLLEPGDALLVGQCGYFGERMVNMAGRMGARVRTVETAWGEVLAPEQVEAALRKTPAKVVAVVHAETSTGARQPLPDIAAVCRRYDALLVVDAVTSWAGEPLEIDAWGIDAAYACTQKCLSAPPGLAPITLGPRALAAIERRRTPVQSWYLDATLLQNYWQPGSQRVYHHTAPVSMIYALREALRIAVTEGLAARWERHARAHRALVAGLEAMDLQLHVPADRRLAVLNTVLVPAGVDEAGVRARLLQRDVEIAAGLGPLKGRIWRIGLMGYNAELKNVLTLLAALESALLAAGHRLRPGAAVEAAIAAG